MDEQIIEPFTKSFTATMSPPGSKSLTNRALVLAALGDGVSELTNVLFADDTHVMLECLGRLGFAPEIDRQAIPCELPAAPARFRKQMPTCFVATAAPPFAF